MAGIVRDKTLADYYWDSVFRPSLYDTALVSYVPNGVSQITYIYQTFPIQRVDFTYNVGGQIISALITNLLDSSTRTATFTYTGDDLTSWSIS